MARSENGMSAGVVLMVAIALVVMALYFLQDVLLPLALAALLAFLLSPLVSRLERFGVNRIAASVVAVAMAMGTVGGILWLVTDQFIQVADDLPNYEQTLLRRIRSVRGLFTGGSGEVAETVGKLQEAITGEDGAVPPPPAAKPPAEQEALPVRVVSMDTEPLPVRLLRDWTGPLLAPLGTAAVVIVFVLFMLIKREDLRDRVIRLAGTRKVYVTTQALDEAGGRVSRYLLMQLVINATYGLAVGVGLFFIGVPNPALWGLLAAVCRFVPYVGPWLAALLPIALSLAVFHGWTRPLLTVGLFVALELFSNNVMEPWLYGSSTGVSAVGIIVSATFWTWLWGPIGLVLSMPLTVCVVVLGRHVPQLGFFSVLLSDEPPLELGVRFYQRLLAFDEHEASDLVGTFLQSGSMDDLFEKMLIPALSMAELDRNEGLLSDQQQRFIHRVIRDVISDTQQQFDTSASAEAVTPGAAEVAAASSEMPLRSVVRVLCLPAEDRADRLAGRMLTQLLAARGHQASTLAHRANSHEVLEEIGKDQPQVVVISALAPGGAVAAREACRRLRLRYPAIRIVVGLWNAHGRLAKTRDRVTGAGASLVSVSLAEALEAIPDLVDRPVAGVA